MTYTNSLSFVEPLSAQGLTAAFSDATRRLPSHFLNVCWEEPNVYLSYSVDSDSLQLVLFIAHRQR